MSKYEDKAMELIVTVAENGHHSVAKPFKRGAMPKVHMINAKSTETGMLLERINKLAKVQNLLLDQLNIRNGSKGLTPVSLQEVLSCANCSRFDHVELDCPIMAIQGQGMFRQGPLGGLTQQGRPNFLSPYLNYYNTPIFNNNPSHHAGFRNPILHHTAVSNNINNLAQIKDRHRSSRRLNRKLTYKLHARLHRHQTQSSERSRN